MALDAVAFAELATAIRVVTRSWGAPGTGIQAPTKHWSTGNYVPMSSQEPAGEGCGFLHPGSKGPGIKCSRTAQSHDQLFWRLDPL